MALRAFVGHEAIVLCLLKEDLANFCKRASQSTESDVLLADVNHYRVNEHQAQPLLPAVIPTKKTPVLIT